MEKSEIKIGGIYLHSNGQKVKVTGIHSGYIPIECEWVDSVGGFNCVPGYLSPIPSNEAPRRIRLDLFSPTELAIYNVQQMIEKMPADVRLTLAGEKLREARSLVADFIDSTDPIQPKVENSSPKGPVTLTDEEILDKWREIRGGIIGTNAEALKLVRWARGEDLEKSR